MVVDGPRTVFTVVRGSTVVTTPTSRSLCVMLWHVLFKSTGLEMRAFWMVFTLQEPMAPRDLLTGDLLGDGYLPGHQ